MGDINIFVKAIIRGNIREVERMIENGIDVNTKDDFGDLPLIVACQQSYEMFELLLNKGAKTDILDGEGKFPLMYAIELDKINLLLKKGADPNFKGKDGNTALHHLVKMAENPKSKGLNNAIKKKIEALIFNVPPANPNIENKKGDKPFDNKHIEQIFKHLSSFLDINDFREYANIPAAVEYFLKNNLVDLNEVDEEGNTILMLILENDYEKYSEAGDEARLIELYETYMKHSKDKLNFNARNNYNETILTLIILNTH